METFKHLYLNACADIRREPDQRLLFLLESANANNTSTLNFSESSLSVETCRAVGLALAKDIYVTHLDFSNCMLCEEGLTEILKGLMNNKTVLSLNLMGNNIKSNGAVVLGKFLQRNSHLLQLNLDWNSLGLLPDRFAVFCQSLIYNNRLKELDLGHNQLSYLCAASLGSVITKNSSLEILRLQFNSFGPVGGEYFLKALVWNKTLTQLPIEGNNLGTTIENSIEMAIKKNSDKKKASLWHADEAKVLANKLQELENEKNVQLKVLSEALVKKENEVSNEHRLNSMNVTQLQSVLAEKEYSLELIKSECKHLEASLSDAQKKLNDLSNLVNEMNTENSNLKVQHASILSQEKKASEEVEKKLWEELDVSRKVLLEREQQINDLKHELSREKNSNQRLSQQISNYENQLKCCEDSYREQIDALKRSHSEALKKNEHHLGEVSRLNVECSSVEQRYIGKIEALENHRMRLEVEISELNHFLENTRQEKDQALLEQQQKTKNEERLRKQMEQKLEIVLDAKENQKKLFDEQAAMLESCMAGNAVLTLELEKQAHQVQKLHQKLGNLENESKAQTARIKLEYKEQVEQLTLAKEQNKELSSQILLLNKQLEDAQTSHSQELKQKELEVEQLKRELHLQKQKTEAIIEEQTKHASQLHAAVSCYIQGVQQAAQKQSELSFQEN